MVATLPCELTRPIRRRIFVDENSVKRLLQHLQLLHDENIIAAHEHERDFITNHPPTVALSYKDGTEYKISDLLTLEEVIPGKGKAINSLVMGTVYGSTTCEISFKDWTMSDSIKIRLSGSEEKITHFADTIISELTRDSDITVVARKVWPLAWAFLFSCSFWLPLAWKEVHDFSTLYGLGMLTVISTLVLFFPIDFFRGRWLKPVAYLWGVDGRRAKQAKSIVTGALVTLPLWFVGNLASRLFFY